MGLLDILKKLVGMDPVVVGDLNRAVLSRPSKASSAVGSEDPLAGIEITEEFRTVLGHLERKCPLILVNGQAGTGKTTLIQVIRHTLRWNIAVVAPTGVAALNAKGVTIHSFFRFPFHILTKEDIEEPRDRQLFAKLDLLIVDEISMVRVDIIDAIDMLLRRYGPNSDRPFGGVQLLFVGDLFQLQPVTPPSELAVLRKLYGTPFFFSANALQKQALAFVELTKAYRQRDIPFIEMLNKLRVAEEMGPVIEAINARCYGIRSRDDAITLSCTNATADGINSERLTRLPGEPKTFMGLTTGTFRMEETKLPSPMRLTLKPASQVMFTMNDTSRRWVNGTLGKVVSLAEDSVRVELLTDHAGEQYEVPRATWETYKYEFDPVEDRVKPVITGSYTQIPLMLAWAVTIHKSQGKTLEKVHLDLGSGAFTAGQVYVALSRCRKLEDITLARPIRPDEVTCDERIRRFFLALAAGRS
jgi:ATP-dependent DNA helicase PIF1